MGFKKNKYLKLNLINHQGKIIIPVGHVGVGGEKGYIYNTNGICPCLPASQWKDPTKVIINDRR